MANFNVPPLGSSGVGGVNNHPTKGVVVGAPVAVKLTQGTDLGDALTGVIADQWIAPCNGTIREFTHSNYSVAATMSFLIYNSTQAANVVGATTPTTNTAARVTSITTAAVTEADLIQLKVTTSGGSGASKGLPVTLWFEPFTDSSSNPYAA
jgi:hypothetical protein